MNALSIMSGGQTCSFVCGSHIHLRKNTFAPDLQRSLFRGIGGAWLKHFPCTRGGSGYRHSVSARIKRGQKHEYPWPDNIDPNMESGHLSYLSHFKPLKEKPRPVTLHFEKPLVDLEKKIIDVRKMADETGLDFTHQINLLESKYQEALKELYTHLTPIQRLSIARHPNRPTCLDHILKITDKWVELHGDRAGYDDPAIVTGIGTIDGKRYLFIGHQKGRNTKENIQRNFGMPTPHGYRKALRMMKYADHHGFPIITFIDTPGAFADLKSEELGQGEAIAQNLRTMFGLKVPIVTVVIGEGGSGGALAIACANKLLMLENSVFYVASPEACAAILWKSSQAAPKAAEKLKITATELCKLKIADGIIPEPLGGAHADPAWTSHQMKLTVTKAMEELGQLDTEGLLRHRHDKYRQIGGFMEGVPVDPKKKRNMKKKDTNISGITADIESEIEKLKKAALESKIQSPGPIISKESVEKLKREIDKEMTDAFISMGLQEKLKSVKMEISKSNTDARDQALAPKLKEKVDQLVQEFNYNMSRPGSYVSLKQKLRTLSEVSKVMELKTRGERLKMEINEKLRERAKAKIEILRKARDKVSSGEPLDESEMEEVRAVQEDLKSMLKSVNLEVVGSSRKTVTTAPPDLEKKLADADEVIKNEIVVVIDAAGLAGKIHEMKTEMEKGSSKEKVESLYKEISEGILDKMDITALKKKVASSVDLQIEAIIGSSNQ